MTKVHDVHDEDLIAEVELAYFELHDAQIEYRNSQITGEKEGSIMLTINDESTEHIDSGIEITVDDAEELAYKILGLCAAVKKDENGF